MKLNFKNLFKKKPHYEFVEFNDLNIEKTYSTSDIKKEDFNFTQLNESIHDLKFETKPVSYFKDCFLRFAKNKASIAAACVIGILVLYAIIVPAVDPKSNVPRDVNQNGFQDSYYANVIPKAFENSGFWDGTEIRDVGESVYKVYDSVDQEQGVERKRIKEVVDKFFQGVTAPNGQVISGSTMYRVRYDTYAVGNIQAFRISNSDYQRILDYQEEHDVTILMPLVDYETYVNVEYRQKLEEQGVSSSTIESRLTSIRQYYVNGKGNYWFKLERVEGSSGNAFVPVGYDDNALEDIYLRDSEGNLVYSTPADSNNLNVRVNYEHYFEFKYGFEPTFLFGTTNGGRDIWTRLAEGARFSLLLGIGVSVVNFIIGIIWGSIAGYYGGRVDLTMERITDIISAIPSIVILNIVNTHFPGNNVLGLIVALILPGWIGTASLTRMQFYRFKGQEYVLASRTLGARDTRLIFKHIFPNAIGTLVTSSVLMIPSVIFSESSLTFLGIINLGEMVSVGSLLDEGQKSMTTFPHAVLFPALLISLLMISFNLFGNGLRDAFNTTLRGADN